MVYNACKPPYLNEFPGHMGWNNVLYYSLESLTLPPSPSFLPLGSVQEIDGKALMLLRSDMVMKYMGLKLGPALKLCYHIERLKQGKQWED